MDELRSEIRAAFEKEQAAHPPAVSLRRNVISAIAAQTRREPSLPWVAVAAAIVLGILMVAGLLSTRFAHRPAPAAPPIASPIASLPNMGPLLGATMVPLTSGQGDRAFPAFTPTGQSLFVEFACRSNSNGSLTATLTRVASGQLEVSASAPCSEQGSVLDEFQGVLGHQLVLTVSASPDTVWEVYVGSGPSTPATP